MALANYTRERILRHIFGQDLNWSSNSHFYVGFTSGALAVDGSNMIDVEFSGGGYTRKIYQNSSFFWGHDVSGEVYNKGSLEWIVTEAWGLAKYFFLSDNATIGEGDYVIVSGELNTQLNVGLDDHVQISANDIIIGLI